MDYAQEWNNLGSKGTEREVNSFMSNNARSVNIQPQISNAEASVGGDPSNAPGITQDQWSAKLNGKSSVDYASEWSNLGKQPVRAFQSDVRSVDNQSAPAPAKGVSDITLGQLGNSVKGGVSAVGRQVGLTARDVLNAAGSTVGIFANPIDELLDMATGGHATRPEEFTNHLADTLGLPSPENSTERIANAAATAMGTAASITGAAVSGAKMAQGVSKAVLSALGSSHGAAVASGAGAGAASQGAAESGAGPWGQIAAGLAGGILAPSVVSGVMKAIPAAANKAAETVSAEKELLTGKPSAQPVQHGQDAATQTIANAGIDPGSVPARTMNAIRQYISETFRAKAPIAEDQVARVARAGKWNTQLTPAQITQDPALAQAEFNNEGIASAGQSIRNFKTTNERNFLGAVDDKIASYKPTTVSTPETGAKVADTLAKIDSGLKETVDDAYTAARSMVGNDTPVPMQPIAQKLGQLHEEEGIGQLGGAVTSFLKKRGLLDSNGTPSDTQTRVFTVKDADTLRKVMNRNAPPPTDPAAIRTMGELRSAVNDSEGMLADSGDQIGAQAAQAFAKARAAHAARMQLQEQVPALKAAVQGASGDKFLQDFVYGNNKNATIENTSKLMTLLNTTGQTNVINEIRADVGRQVREAIQPRGSWQSDAPLSGDGAVKFIQNRVGNQKFQAIMGPDAPVWNEAAQVASDLKFIPARTHAQVSGNYAAIGSLLEKMENKPTGGATGTIAEIGKGVPFIGPYAHRVAQGFSARAQQGAADRFINEVTSGKIPVNAGTNVISSPRIPIGALLAPQYLSGAPGSKNNERAKQKR